MNLRQFRDYAVRPALERVGLYSLAAERLVLGTALTESNLEYIDQMESPYGDLKPGPAYGFFQIEAATHDDIWRHYLRYQKELGDKVRHLMCMMVPEIEQLRTNLQYAAAMCRVHYRRVPAALPNERDLGAMALYWKRHYNTPAGKGEPEDFLRRAQPVMDL